MYHFIALMYYFGIVKLPSKQDYFSTDPIMPSHPPVQELGMTRDRFKFLWRHFHCNTVTDEELDAEIPLTDNDNGNGDELMEGVPEQILQDQEQIVWDQELGNRKEGESDDEEENEEENEEEDEEEEE